jgi:hypothetical protein
VRLADQFGGGLAARLPASRAATIRPAARLICSAPATEVPPNFITTMSEPLSLIGS